MKRFLACITAVILTLAMLCGCVPSVKEALPDGTANRPSESPLPARSDNDIVDLRVNYEIEPECVEYEPVFSWAYNTETRNLKQTAYNIRLALSEEDLNNGNIVWDSGVVESSDMYGIKYTGDYELKEAAKYFWDVTVTTNKGDTLRSDVSTFSTALVETGFDGASWIQASTPKVAIENGNWIWYLNGDSQGSIPVKTEYFKYIHKLDKKVKSAMALFSADDYGELYINGKEAISISIDTGWSMPRCVDVTEFFTGDQAVFAARCMNKEAGYAAIIAVINIVYEDGTEEVITTDRSWYASEKKPSSGWESSDSVRGFTKINSSIIYGGAPWNSNCTVQYENSAPIMRNEFNVSGKVKSAFLYASAAGLYDAYVNGKKVDESALNPGRSEYQLRVMYQSYDVTELLTEGANAIGAVLGRGWYIGAYSPYGGTDPAFICKLVIDYEDGRREYVTTGGNWQVSLEGPIYYNDIFNGELYDATMEIEGFSNAGCKDDSFIPVSVVSSEELNIGSLVPQLSGKVTVKKVIQAQTVTKVGKDDYIYDFGQNIAGICSITATGQIGYSYVLRHAEMLNDGNTGSDGPAGTLYTANLRTASATDKYTFKGDPDGETYTPTFTYHGFRYLEINGLSSALPLQDVKALVLYSDLEDSGRIETSDELINKLYLNTLWGQRGNFLSTPTDCPQRDERMGWSGDAQIFCGTAAYNMNVKTFFDKYITDLNDCQHGDGSYPDVAPETGRANYGGSGNNAWGDAGVIIPWIMYERYGDMSYIEKYYDNMSKYAKYLFKTSKNYIREVSAYGDWLAIESTPVGVTDTAYCVRVFDILSEMAKLLGKDDDAVKFKENADNYRTAWVDKYVRSEGKLKSDTQTAYLVALAFEIVPEDMRASLAARLNEKIIKKGTLTTGFIGCNLLLPVLCEYGYEETAFMLLQNEEYPSWKYPILQGATTIWERWNSYTVENGFGDAGMNSFNHYSYGSVTEWLYDTLVGIKSGEAGETFMHFVLRPTCGGGLLYAKGEYNSLCGLIKSSWNALGDKMTVYNCTVPGNTSATLYLKAESLVAVKEGGVSLGESEGVTVVSFNNGVVELLLGSGTYNFTIEG